MDPITQTSLEALLLKATNSKNLNIDTAAVEAFTTLINKEKDGAHIGVKVIATRLPMGNEKEVLQTLNVLDSCMSRCGTPFQNEVGKFRFLNEMIKLVSPKYLGSQTPLTVKQKVLQLLYVWTLDYPKEIKIREAFDMLRKQGVIREIPNPNVPSFEPVSITKRRLAGSVFHDEEKSKILQKLLQSKDPEDIQAANWLIKSMVKEDDKRAEMKSKRISELESVQNNVRLLNEMLDTYKPGISSTGELDLIRELYQNCERLRPSINKLASETHHTEGMLSDVLEASDELSTVSNKYNILIIQGKPLPPKTEVICRDALLHFDQGDCRVEKPMKELKIDGDSAKSSIDMLCDIFTTSKTTDDIGDILQPVSVLKCDKTSVCDDDKEKKNKLKALEDLDVLSEHFLKENLQYIRQTNFCRVNQEKIPMNRLSKLEKKAESTISKPDNFSLDLNYLLKSKTEPQSITLSEDVKVNIDTNDDFLVDISNDERMLEMDQTPERERPSKPDTINGVKCNEIGEQNMKGENTKKNDVKLNDIVVKLENIKPSNCPPTMLMEEKNGISVTLHLAKDKPKDCVSIYVLTTVSKNDFPLSNYLFQAVIPKGCKLKLQTPSSTDLPAYNPFLPPSAITQIMLIANPDRIQISLKFIVSYIMDDETITEMGEMDSLPTT